MCSRRVAACVRSGWSDCGEVARIRNVGLPVFRRHRRMGDLGATGAWLMLVAVVVGAALVAVGLVRLAQAGACRGQDTRPEHNSEAIAVL